MTLSNPLNSKISTQPTKIQPVHPNLPKQPKIWCIPPTFGPSRNWEGPYIVQPIHLRHITLSTQTSLDIQKYGVYPQTLGPSRNQVGPYIVQPINLRHINPTTKDSIRQPEPL